MKVSDRDLFNELCALVGKVRAFYLGMSERTFDPEEKALLLSEISAELWERYPRPCWDLQEEILQA